MTRLIDVYGVEVKLWYDKSNERLPDWRLRVERFYLNRLLARICKEHGTLEFLIFLYDFVRLHGILPILKDFEKDFKGNYPNIVAEVLAETSVDITDKAAIRAIEKLTD